MPIVDIHGTVEMQYRELVSDQRKSTVRQ
jgi:hypothetical protein